jgi:hypothetical protein
MLSQQLRNFKAGTNIDKAYFFWNRVSGRHKILPLRLYGTVMHCVLRTLQQVRGKCRYSYFLDI